MAFLTNTDTTLFLRLSPDVLHTSTWNDKTLCHPIILLSTRILMNDTHSHVYTQSQNISPHFSFIEANCRVSRLALPVPVCRTKGRFMWCIRTRINFLIFAIHGCCPGVFIHCHAHRQHSDGDFFQKNKKSSNCFLIMENGVECGVQRQCERDFH